MHGDTGAWLLSESLREPLTMRNGEDKTTPTTSLLGCAAFVRVRLKKSVFGCI